jgi:predicted nucleic acid-binding protein
MLVIADTSPLIGLLKIGHVDVLPRLYGSVVIPPQVAAELASRKRPPEVQAFIAAAPPWLSTRSPAKVEEIEGIDLGERAAISLARELKADLLLIDESKGREAAIARHIRTARTAAVLFDAANAGVLPDLKEAFDKLKATNFRVPATVLDELLKRHEQIKTQQAEMQKQKLQQEDRLSKVAEELSKERQQQIKEERKYKEPER